jgi:hypothetical protein
MSRRAHGSNQYVSRNLANVPVAELDLMAQTQPLRRQRCGDVWGTRCRSWVQPPQFSHGRHGVHHEDTSYWQVPPDLGPNCPPEVLTHLASGGHQMLRQEAARHHRCPPATLAQLAVDPRPQVRLAVSYNINCPPYLLDQLGKDSEWAVRVAVAGHHNCPPDTLVRMLADESPEVRIVARHNDSLPDEYRSLVKASS